MAAYYRSPQVRPRIAEYGGGSADGPATFGALGLAAREAATMPDATEAPGWANAYWHGPLSEFHRGFDQGPHLDPAAWPYTYDLLLALPLPACVRLPVERPNPQFAALPVAQLTDA
jgi:hypothetical protein